MTKSLLLTTETLVIQAFDTRAQVQLDVSTHSWKPVSFAHHSHCLVSSKMPRLVVHQYAKILPHCLGNNEEQLHLRLLTILRFLFYFPEQNTILDFERLASQTSAFAFILLPEDDFLFEIWILVLNHGNCILEGLDAQHFLPALIEALSCVVFVRRRLFHGITAERICMCHSFSSAMHHRKVEFRQPVQPSCHLV